LLPPTPNPQLLPVSMLWPFDPTAPPVQFVPLPASSVFWSVVVPGGMLNAP